MNSCAYFMRVRARLRGMQNVPTKLYEKVACRSKKQHPFDLEVLIPSRHKPCETGNIVDIDVGTRDDPCRGGGGGLGGRRA